MLRQNVYNKNRIKEREEIIQTFQGSFTELKNAQGSLAPSTRTESGSTARCIPHLDLPEHRAQSSYLPLQGQKNKAPIKYQETEWQWIAQQKYHNQRNFFKILRENYFQAKIPVFSKGLKSYVSQTFFKAIEAATAITIINWSREREKKVQETSSGPLQDSDEKTVQALQADSRPVGLHSKLTRTAYIIIIL